jgi:hypothetical protein
MAKRHVYAMRFRCPKCHKAGSAKWEEYSRVAHGEPMSVLKTISEGFRANPQEEITCTACSARVVFGHG